MNIVLVIPTGIGAEIGGHAGDGNGVAKLLASVADNLITHPNVLNASDINEMPNNTLYVEGSMLDRFLRGEINLKKAKGNRILLAVNKVNNDIINATSAARATIGANIRIIELNTPLLMKACMKNGKATGDISGWDDLVEQVNEYYDEFDALAIASPIEVNKEAAENYLINGGVNPWGGIEAKGSKRIADALDKPVAHAPFGNTLENFDQVVDPRMAAETVSVAYIHCVFKGLHKAPRVSYNSNDLSVKDVDCLITPINCVGEPHWACIKEGIPIIAVKENKTVLNDVMPDSFIVVDNYLEAVGMVQLLKLGMTVESVRRPLPFTTIIK